MALYYPIEMQPYNGTIDATLANTFSCVIRGNGVKYYQLYIYLNSNGTQVYTTGVITLSTTLNDMDELDIAIPSGTLINGNEYKWSISVSTDNSNYIASVESVFYAYRNPTLTINPFSSTIASNVFTPTATYSQENGIDIQWFYWVLYDEWGDIVTTTDQIRDVTITYMFNGLINNKSYKIQVFGMSQNDVPCQSAIAPFTVSYSTSDTIVNATTTLDCTRDSVTLTWPQLKQINGSNDGTYSFSNFNLLKGYMPAVQINSGSDLYWNNNVEINDNFTGILKTRIYNDGTIIEFDKQSTGRQRSLSYFIGRLYYIYDNLTVEQYQILRYSRAILFGLRPNDVYVRQFNMDFDGGDSTIPTSYDYSFDGGDSTTTDYDFFIDCADKEAILLSGHGANNFQNAELVPAGNASEFSNAELLKSGGIDVYYMNT